MIDEEKIWDMVDNVFKANDYARNISEVSDYDWETPLWDEEQMKDAIEKGIRCGIQEFIKSLWHDASEEPKQHKMIVAITGGTDSLTNFDAEVYNFPFKMSKGDWVDLVDQDGIVRWCYLSDLLPKEGGEGCTD